MNVCRRTAIAFLIFAAGLLCSGCQKEDTPEPLAFPDTGTVDTPTETLTLSVTRIDGDGGWVSGPTQAPKQFSDVRKVLESELADESTTRSSVTLQRVAGATGQQIGFKQNSDGTIETAVHMRFDGKWFEAIEHAVESNEILIDLFEAFYNKDAAIRTMIEWDELIN